MPSRERSLRLATDSLVPFAPEYRKFPASREFTANFIESGLAGAPIAGKSKGSSER
jgi:hypothetical protein